MMVAGREGGGGGGRGGWHAGEEPKSTVVSASHSFSSQICSVLSRYLSKLHVPSEFPSVVVNLFVLFTACLPTLLLMLQHQDMCATTKIQPFARRMKPVCVSRSYLILDAFTR
eukprot:761247-Hanusia_phi.AAC.2